MAKKIVSQWSAIEEAVQRGEKFWVGVDVHTKKYAVCILTESGVWHSFITPADDKGLARLFTERGLRPEVVVYEAGLTGFGLYRACQEAGLKGMVVSANRIPRPACKGAKTDLIDCRLLAELASKKLLKGIYVPTEEQEARRALFRRRQDLARILGKAKVKIKSFLTCHGLPVPSRSWSEKEIAQLTALAAGLRPGLKETLESLLNDLNYLRQAKAKVNAEVKALVLPQDKPDVLQSAPGVGPVVSAAFRAEIIDPKRFDSPEQLTGFTGLAPTVKQSGESRGQAHLIPSGQGALRSLLIESAWILLGKSAWAKTFYKRLLARGGSSQKAITALARKLAIILWRLWLEDRFYVDDYQSTPISE